MEPRRIVWNWWVWSRKKPGIFHDALVLPERQKIQFDYGWRIALLHGIIKSHNGLNIKFSNN
jgi:hypothetical protein